MSAVAEQPIIKVPSTYQDWLDCLDMMKSGTGVNAELFEAVCRGTFSGTELTRNALQRQIVETVNALLNKSIKKFTGGLNDNLMFNELQQTELLFKRLKREINSSMFFMRLAFLPMEFRAELEASVKEQMGDFWADTVKLLHEQAVELSNPDLEDVLLLVNRIKLF